MRDESVQTMRRLTAELRSVGRRIPPAVKVVRTFRRLRRDWRSRIRVGEAEISVPREMRWTVGGGDYYERNLTATLERLIHMIERPIVYDIGANFGFYTVKLCRDAQWVYAFEPVTATFEVLQQNIHRNLLANITAFKLALFDSDTEMPMKLYSSSGTDSLLWTLPNEHPAKLLGTEMVRVSTLDLVIEEKRLRPPDLMKIDVEGAELPVLRGARRVISRTQPVLALEARPEPWFDSGYSRDALFRELFRHGYVLAGLSRAYDDFKLYEVEQFDSAEVVNVIAVPSKRRCLLEELGRIHVN
jgi:FkbM family methyltransferase